MRSIRAAWNRKETISKCPDCSATMRSTIGRIAKTRRLSCKCGFGVEVSEATVRELLTMPPEFERIERLQEERSPYAEPGSP